MSSGASPGAFPESDYAAIEAAVMETERGRWFLTEHARRCQGAETATVLEAVERLERTVSAREAAPDSLILHELDALRRMLAMIRGGDGDPAAPPAHEPAAQSASSATSAIRRATEKISEVAYELRESARMDIYANSLDLYCSDLAAACGTQEAATSQLVSLASLIGSIEDCLARLVAGPQAEMVIVETTPPPAPAEPPSPPAAAAAEPSPAVSDAPEAVEDAMPEAPASGDAGRVLMFVRGA
ncbi:MAG: hypothetical protein KIS96_13400 [Bauldia sp.]|nr:hypothetical protein [Bauldia sp.]